MITGPLYEVWCDDRNHDQVADGPNQYGGSMKRAWQTARKRGWRKVKGQHICRICIERAAEAHARKSGK